MNLRFFLIGTVILFLAGACASAGDLTERRQLTLQRVTRGGPPQYTDELILADVEPRDIRRFTNYSGDVSGRYLDALAASEAWLGQPLPSLGRLVPAILKLQKPEGFFGAKFGAEVDQPEMALLWGNGRLLIGLLEYQERHPSPEVLSAARRLGDFLVRIGPRLNSEELRQKVDAGADFASAYICWTQQIEGLVRLHRATREPRYLDLAREIAARIRRGPGQHSHGFLSSVRGLIDLAHATGERAYLEQAERDWRGIIESGNLLPQGAVPEALAPKILRTEGCSEADWLRLSLTLWRETRKPEYLEQAELTLFNEFALNQFETGDFGSRLLTPAGLSSGADHQGAGTARAWWCCTLHGLRAFAEVARTAFRQDGDTLYYDLPVDGRSSGGGLTLVADSNLARDASITLRVVEAGAAAVRIRVPGWASGVTPAVNGAPQKAAVQDGYVTLKHNWQAGDTVRLRYRMRTRAMRYAGRGRVGLFHGPWMLGVDEQLSPYFFDEPSTENRLRIAIAADGAVVLKPAPPAQPGRFAVPIARFQVPYLPGGYPMFPATATLRPIAEQTGTRSLAWDFLFRVEEPR